MANPLLWTQRGGLCRWNRWLITTTFHKRRGEWTAKLWFRDRGVGERLVRVLAGYDSDPDGLVAELQNLAEGGE